MEPILAIVIAVGVLILLVLLWLIVNYNRFQRIRQHIRESWSDIDVELKRRYDLIPNLVRTAEGYAAHERETLERVIELRNKAASSHASYESQGVDESALMLGVKKLFAVAEAYPDLKADEQFLALQQQLSLTEDRIAASRRFFNANIREWNQLCLTLPTNVLASIFHFDPETFFELDAEAERVVPRIDFS